MGKICISENIYGRFNNYCTITIFCVFYSKVQLFEFWLRMSPNSHWPQSRVRSDPAVKCQKWPQNWLILLSEVTPESKFRHNWPLIRTPGHCASRVTLGGGKREGLSAVGLLSRTEYRDTVHMGTLGLFGIQIQLKKFFKVSMRVCLAFIFALHKQGWWYWRGEREECKQSDRWQWN